MLSARVDELLKFASAVFGKVVVGGWRGLKGCVRGGRRPEMMEAFCWAPAHLCARQASAHGKGNDGNGCNGANHGYDGGGIQGGYRRRAQNSRCRARWIDIGWFEGGREANSFLDKGNENRLWSVGSTATFNVANGMSDPPTGTNINEGFP